MNSQFLEQWKKHIPWIVITDKLIEIIIGYELIHPMSNEHYITNIDILEYTKAWLLRKKEFLLKSNQSPKISLAINDLWIWTYKVQARCNLHWTFEADFVL